MMMAGIGGYMLALQRQRCHVSEQTAYIYEKQVLRYLPTAVTGIVAVDERSLEVTVCGHL